MGYLHSGPGQIADASGAIGNNQVVTRFMFANLSPFLREIRADGSHRAPFPAADGAIAAMAHFVDFQPQAGQEDTHCLVCLLVVTQGAGIVDGNPAPGDCGSRGINCARKWRRQDLPGRLDGQPLAILLKNLETVGAGDNNASYTVLDQPVLHRGKLGQEKGLAAKIVGGLMTAIEHHAQMRQLFFELLKKFPGGLRPGPREGAAWEKNRVTASRQAIPGKETRVAATFVAQDGTVWFEWELVAGHDPASHLQKKKPRGDVARADGGAEIAQTAQKGIDSGIARQQRGGNVTRRTILLEKCALGHTGLTASTFLV